MCFLKPLRIADSPPAGESETSRQGTGVRSTIALLTLLFVCFVPTGPAHVCATALDLRRSSPYLRHQGKKQTGARFSPRLGTPRSHPSSSLRPSTSPQAGAISPRQPRDNPATGATRALERRDWEHPAMCRKVVFSGACPHCSDSFTWDELTQELSCLEAKNNGVFGLCKEGTTVDEKEHDQECDTCAAEQEADEGYDGGTEDALELAGGAAGWAGGGGKGDSADQEQDSGKHRNKKQRTS